MDPALAGRIAACLVVAYLLGAIPWALIISRYFYRCDLRQHGSGNLGATNVMRVLGWKAALVVFALDMAKGVAAVLLASYLVPQAVNANAHEWAMLGATLAVIAGHSFSPYLGFRGGKGVAAGAGALLVLVPAVWVILLVSFVVVVAIWRMVSLGSVVIAAEFPVLCLLLYPGDWPLFVLAVVSAGLVIWRHSSNIARITRGEEPRISLRGDSGTGGRGV